MTEQAEQVCAACGARNASEASFCGSCGQSLLGGPEIPNEGRLPAPSALGMEPGYPLSKMLAGGDESPGLEPAEDGEGSQAAFAVPAEQVAQKRCSWCSNLNDWTAAVCEHCGAHVPIPEQDEAFRRAAEERMRQDIESLNFLSQRRRRG